MIPPTSPLPNAINWRNLIFSGRDLLNPQRTGEPPTEEHIRRSVSSAYYGLFHALAASNADVLIGTPHDTITASAWTRFYRALNHGTARTELRRHRQEFSAAGQNFADVFGGLQDLRHSADYDPTIVFTGFEATAWLALAEVICIDFLQAQHHERAYIATLTLLRGR